MKKKAHADPLAFDDSLRLAKQKHYDSVSDGEFVTSLVSAIAEVLDADPLDTSRMPPLFYSLDPELLEKILFEQMPATGDTDPDKTMIFDYDELTVAVRNNGWVFVYEPEMQTV